MKRRFLSLALAISMIASLIPATGIAAEEAEPVSSMTVTLTGNSKKDIPVSADTPVKTVVLENGVAVVNTGIVDGWVVKMDYNAGGIPTMTLKNASATEITARASNTASLHIVLEGVNSLVSAAALSANGRDITISGTGTLNITGNDGLGTGNENITVMSGTVVVNTQYQCVRAKNLVVEGGSLSATTAWSGTQAIKADSITVKGGTVEAYAPNKQAVNVAPNLSQYNGNYAAIGGTSSTDNAVYDAASATTYKYFKVYAHTHTQATRTETTLTDCTAGGVQTTVTYCTDCGAVLNTAQETLPAGEHTYTNAMDYDCNVCGTITQVWTAYMTVSVSGSKKHLDVTPANPVKYIAMVDGVASVVTAEPENWIVKMDLNNCGVPTLTLRNASVTEITAHTSNTASLHIVLEGVNSLVSAAALSANGRDITISGTGTLNITGSDGLGTGNENITVMSGTVIVNTQYQCVRAKNLVVEGGTLSATTAWSGTQAIKADSITVKGGTVEAYAPNKQAVNVAPNLSQYSGNYAAIGGTSSTDNAVYDAASATAYKYFKVYSHTHTQATRFEVIITDCTVGAAQTTFTYCTDCGTILNVEQDMLPAGEHTYTNDMDYDCNVCGTITQVWTSYMTVSVSGSKKHLDVTPANPVKYIAMVDGVASVVTAEPENWIVKMDLNNCGVPTLTLRNAETITAIEAWSTNTAPVNIVLEGVNTVTTTNNPLNARGYDITFSGTGTLNVTPTAGTGIGTGSETVTVDGATVNVSTVWFGMEVKNLVVESGSLSVTTSRDDKVAINASDSITVKGGTVEVYSAKGALSVAPDLSQYSSYTAVGGVSSIFTSTYDPTSAVLYKYIKIEPLGSGTGSDDDNDGVKPFYALAWDYIDESLTPNVNECVFLSVTVTDGNVGFRMDGVGTDMDAIVANVKMEMAARPQGMRYLCIPGIDQALSMAPEAIIYLDTGVNKLKEQFTLFLQKYYALGGQLDGVVIDLEYLPMGSWYIYAQGYGGAGNNQNIYNDIVNHPKYQTEVRPMLEARNFTFYTQVGGEKSEIWSICHKTGNAYEADRCIWDVVMRSRLSQYMNEALFAPLTTYYPNAILSDYQSTDTYGWLKDLHDDGGRPVYQGGNYMKTGNTSNFNFYGSRPGNNYYVSESTGLPVYNTPPSYTGAVYKRDAYNMLLWDMMKAKHIVEATDDGFVNFWVGTHDVYYGGYTSGTYANTPYYSELVLHFGLMNPQPFLLYLSKGEYKVDGAVDVDKYNAAVMVMSELLEELTRLVGAEDRTPIAFPVSWNDGYLLSGMSAGGKNIWRITPDTALTTMEGFQVADAVVPTFSVNGRTVSFPQGRIIETAAISQVGTCGYWVETPAGVVPVVKSDADRFEAYPAYGEDYEGFEANTQYTSETALPAATWTVTGTAAVQASGDNQALAVTGDFSLVNTQLPQNITAGDSYAAHQAWQVSVTLPENLDAAAVLHLLTANGDSGVKLTNGKAYYTASGVDTELATLSAGTYVIKRALDFSNNTCDYYVYSAAGTLLGSATDIALPEITLPVTAIAMTGTGLGTAAVLLDDYKLYITGFEGDFELYDADAGVRVVNETAARAADTAYRYSWANASDKVKNATVVASYYDEDNNLLSQQVVKTLRMVPGNDGVETGIVPLGEQAAAVLVSLVFGADTDPTADDFVYTPTADDYNSANDNT